MSAVASATTDTAPTIQEAFAAAKAEHSAPAEHAASDDASTDAGTEVAADASSNEATARPSATDSAATETDLITDEEFAALQAKHGTNFEAFAKDFKAHYTRNTQALAADRSQVKDLLEHADLVKALKADGVGTLRQLAEQNGFTLAPKAAVAQATEKAQETAEAGALTIADRVRTALGADFDFLAEPLTRVVTDAVTALVGDAVKPLQDSHQSLQDKAARDQRDAVMTSFQQRHADWKQHEGAMTALMSQLTPAAGMDPGKYLDMVYDLASKPARDAAVAKKTVERLTRGAAADEGKTTPLSSDKVSIPKRSDLSIREAWEESKRELEGRN